MPRNDNMTKEQSEADQELATTKRSSLTQSEMHLKSIIGNPEPEDTEAATHQDMNEWSPAVTYIAEKKKKQRSCPSLGNLSRFWDLDVVSS